MKKYALIVFLLLCASQAYASTNSTYLDDIIDAGGAFKVGTQDLALADDASLMQLITVSSNVTTKTMLIGEFSSGGDAEGFLYESPTVVSVGTAQSPQRLNRTIATSPEFTASYGGSFSSYGTKICDLIISGGTGKDSSGSGGGCVGYYVLHPGKQYLLRLENEGGGAKVAGICVTIFEDKKKY